MHRNRMFGPALAASLALVVVASPVAATHADGVLDCGVFGTYEVDAASVE